MEKKVYKGEVTNDVVELNLINELPNNSTSPTVVWLDKAGSLEMDHEIGDIEDNWKLGDTDVKRIALGTGCKIIGENAFNGCTNLTGEIILPEGLEKIKINAFRFTNISGKISFPDSMTSDSGEGAFQFSQINEVDLNNLSWISPTCFKSSTLTKVEIPKQIYKIESYSFASCAFLSSVKFYEGTSFKKIGDYAFNNCTILPEICIPSGLTEIGNNVFDGCSILETIYCKSSADAWTGINAFLGVPSTATLYVHEDDFNGYDAAWITAQNFTGTIKTIEQAHKEFVTISHINNISNANYNKQPSFDFVTIGDAGNAPDSETGFGAVEYEYQIGKYAISEGDINAYNSDPINSNEQITMTTVLNDDKKVAIGISFIEAAHYANWLNIREGYPPAYSFFNTSTTGTADLRGISNPTSQHPWEINEKYPDTYNYSFDTTFTLGSKPNIFRNNYSKYFLPTEDEWYKAAFYDPNHGGTGVGGYWDYATGSDTPPTAVSSGTDANTAVYLQSTNADKADVDQAGGLSPYGTMGQTGNSHEWSENSVDGSYSDPYANRIARGGGAKTADATTALIKTYRNAEAAYNDGDFNGRLYGFRICSRLGIDDGGPELGSISYNFDINKYAETVGDFIKYNEDSSNEHKIQLIHEKNSIFFDTDYYAREYFFDDYGVFKNLLNESNTDAYEDRHSFEEFKPAAGFSWNDAAHYVNWLNIKEGYQPAYRFDTDGKNIKWDNDDAWKLGGLNLFRNNYTKYFIPNENEWFKSAFYDHNKYLSNGSSGWRGYSTGDILPTIISSGTDDNSIVAGNAIGGTLIYPEFARVNNCGGSNYYGLMGQMGQCLEYLEDPISSTTSPSEEKIFPYNFTAIIGGRNWSQSGAGYEKVRHLTNSHYYKKVKLNLYSLPVPDDLFPSTATSSSGLMFDPKFNQKVDATNETLLLDNIGLRVASVTEPYPSGSTVIHKINCGGSFTISLWDGSTWSADSNTFPSAYLVSGTVAKTYSTLTDQSVDSSIPTYFTESLGKTERYETNVSIPIEYQFNVSNGDYEVRLYFSEIFHNNVNLRKFNVLIEDVQVLSNFDIFAETGGKNIMTMKKFQTAVSDGVLSVKLTKGSVDSPKISALEIIQL